MLKKKHMLLDFLRCAAPIDTARNVVLIDDVPSSGAHLRAATALLTKLRTQVAGAICASRADNEFVGQDAFAECVEILPDLEPSTFDDVAPLRSGALPRIGRDKIANMTSDERAQLVEDIKRSNNLRHGIVERAALDEGFDILAAWEEVEKLDQSINERVIAARG